MKRVEYTSHAMKQMKDRGIPKWEVRFCLDNHDVAYTDVGGNPIYIGRPGGRRIKVVSKKDSIDPVIIITAAD